MKLYENQLSDLIDFAEFIRDYKQELALNAIRALLEYEGTFSVDYDDYVVFFVSYDDDGQSIWAVSKVLDVWRPIEICSRVRKFTEKRVFPYDSHGHIKFD